MINLPSNSHPASYRDPSGYIYKHESLYYRFVGNKYKLHYEHASKKDLFRKAIAKNLLLNFKETDEIHNTDKEAHYKTLFPDQIVFENYPWEWCFDQYRDAAITTLSLCKLSLQNGMILKDASPLNIRLMDGKMKWIDHLSFEIYKDGDTWIAYRQFCEMFLNPLLIASYCGLEVHRLLKAYPEGLTAQSTAQLLPFHCRFKLHVQLHVFVQANIQSKTKTKSIPNKKLSVQKLMHIIESLFTCINSLRLPMTQKKWSNYYQETILSEAYLKSKKGQLINILSELDYTNVLDAGCNDGTITLLCNNKANIIAADSAPDCINQFYNLIKKNNIRNVYPFVLDLTFPSENMGWNNNEYPAFFQRKKFDLIIALALIHHLCIRKNIPLDKVAGLFASNGKQLIIEFVPKNDPKSQELLLNRENIFENYNEENFINSFSKFYKIMKEYKINNSDRKIYYMNAKEYH